PAHGWPNAAGVRAGRGGALHTPGLYTQDWSTRRAAKSRSSENYLSATERQAAINIWRRQAVYRLPSDSGRKSRAPELLPQDPVAPGQDLGGGPDGGDTRREGSSTATRSRPEYASGGLGASAPQ